MTPVVLNRPPVVLWGILLAAGWQAAGLWGDLRHSPYLAGGVPALILWMAPVAAWWLWPGPRPWRRGPGMVLSWGALAALALGATGDLNALRHVALALALAALWNWRPERVAWLAGAVVWLPAAGWLASRWGLTAGTVTVLRWGAAVTLAAGGIWSVAREKRRQL